MNAIGHYLKAGSYNPRYGDAREEAARDIKQARNQVQRGASLLDEYAGFSRSGVPEDWRERIDPRKLDAGDCTNCVLGQVFGYFEDGFAILKEDSGVQEDALHDRYAFDVGAANPHALTVAWIEELTGERFES